MIRMEQLSLAYGERTVLEHVSMEIPRGTVVGLWGDSGIGKTTLAKSLCGVLPPTEGNIDLEGSPLWQGRSYDRKRGLAIQMVSQQPYAALDPVQRIGDGFYELVRYHGLARSRAQSMPLIIGRLETVGLDHSILQKRPRQISGGEAQRIAVARCLLFRPKLLILDEATSMLDVSTQANVLGLVRREVLKNDGSVLLISHDRALMEACCDRIYLLENRKVKSYKEKGYT